ncbi:MAG: DMT family transporter [Pseudonocardiaceae bacterium]
MTPGLRQRADLPNARTAALGTALALLATLLWAGNFVLARGLRDAIPPIALNFWRWAIAVAVLAPFALRTTLAARHLLRRHFGYLILTGLLGVTVFNTLVYQAGHTTQALNLALLAVCSPIVIVIFAWLFSGEHITIRTILGLAVATCGVLLLVTDGDPRQLVSLDFAGGDLIMVLATVIFGVYTILIGRKPEELPIIAFVFSTFTIGLLMLLPAYLVELSFTGPFTINQTNIAAFLYIGLFPSLVAFYSWNNAVTTIGTTRPAVIYYLIPVFTALGAWRLLDEPIGAAQMLSMILVIAGVAVSHQSSDRPIRARRASTRARDQ